MNENTATVPVVRFIFGGREAAGSGLGRPYTAVYDGACRVCTRSAHLLERWDRRDRIEVIPSRAPGVQARFPWIPERAYAESLQLIGPGGRTWQGAEALDQLLRVLPLGGIFGWVFRIPLMGRVVDRFYRWFARNRYRLGCGDHCQYKPLELNYGDEEEEAAA